MVCRVPVRDQSRAERRRWASPGSTPGRFPREQPAPRADRGASSDASTRASCYTYATVWFSTPFFLLNVVFSLAYIFVARPDRHRALGAAAAVSRAREPRDDLFLILGEQHHRDLADAAPRAALADHPGARPVHRHRHRRRHRHGQDVGLHVSVRRAARSGTARAIRRARSAASSWR